MKKKTLFCLISLLASFALIKNSHAATVNVSVGSSIQSAIDSASDGDLIQLSSGTYKENINFNGKALTIAGIGRASVIKSDGTKAAVTFNSSENNGSILEKLTLKGGVRGGAILIEQASPIIRNCWILNNRALAGGSGAYFFGNDANGNAAYFHNNILALNKTRSAKPGNQAYAVNIEDSSPEIINNTFYKNDGAAIYITGSSSPIIKNNIIAFQSKFRGRKKGRGIILDGVSGSSVANISYNLFYKNKKADVQLDGTDVKSIADFSAGSFAFTINGNFANDPGFIKTKKLKDLGINSSGSAIDLGDPDTSFNDTDASRNDIGATGGPSPITIE